MSLKPVEIPQRLWGNPQQAPQFATSIRNSQGEDVLLACPRAVRIAVALMDLQAVNGGAASHWGGPSAMAEMMSALHGFMYKSQPWYENFHFVNDIGHAENGLYALKAIYGLGDMDLDELKGFRSIHSHLTGHGESHLFPQAVLLSNGPLGSALPQAQGLAMGEKLKGTNVTTVCTISDGACMEGEAKESLSAIPGLFHKKRMNPFWMIISDNQTKLSGRIHDAFSMQETFRSLEVLGWKIIKIEDGHNIQECYQALEKGFELKDQAPICFWVKTIKGRGVKSTEESASGGHGFPLKAYSSEIHSFISEIWGEDEELPAVFSEWANLLTQAPKSSDDPEPSNIKKEKAQAGFARAAIDLVKGGVPLVSVSSDLQGSTGIAPFHKEFPEHCFDVGIAESNMVGCAAGLSKVGLIPVVDTFAAFGVTKGNLPLIMSSLSEAPVLGIFSHIGFQDAADGASHQSLTYLSSLGSIPNLETIVVSTSAQAQALFDKKARAIAKSQKAGEKVSSGIFFVGRENFPSEIQGQSFEWGKPSVLVEGTDGVIVSQGALIHQALVAADILRVKGIKVAVVENPYVNRPCIKSFMDIFSKTKNNLLTVEDHQLIGGAGAQLIAPLVDAGVKLHAKSLGVNGLFGRSAYSAIDLYRYHGLDAQTIAKKFEILLDNRKD